MKDDLRNRASAPAPDEPAALLEPGFLARLERFRVSARRLAESRTAGERRSRALGSSVEFADHREYQFGDDPRYLDWNAYARAERLFIKLFHQESDLAVHVVLDASASMGCGDSAKFLLARRLAAGLAYIALSGSDRAGVLSLGGKPPLRALPGRGAGRVRRLLESLEVLAPEGRPDPAAELRRYLAGQKTGGLAVLVSDMLDERFRDALSVLSHHRQEIWCLHLLSAADRGEDLEGDLELADCETGAVREISATPAVRKAYRAAVASFRAELSAWCRKRGIGYQYLDAGADFEDALLTVLRKRRLIQA